MYHWEIEKEVNQFKKDGKLEEALKLLQACVDFSESEAKNTHRRLYPNAYEDSAIILRKLKRHEEEVEILERFLSNPKSSSEARYLKIAERLEKACVLAGRAEKQKFGDTEKVYYLPENVLFENRSLFSSTGLIVDIETTGLDAGKDEIIELGIVKFQYNRFTQLQSDINELFTELRNPTIPISPAATRVHGLKNKDLVGKSFDENKIHNLFSQADFLIAHNVSFDRNFIYRMYPIVNTKDWYCSMNGISWKNYGYKSKGLQNLLLDHKISIENSHRGLDDAIGVFNLLGQTNKITQKTYLSELLSSFPEEKQEENKSSNTSTYLVKSTQKQKKGLLDFLFGK